LSVRPHIKGKSLEELNRQTASAQQAA